MNTGITGTPRLLALIILTAAVVACTGNDADTAQFQGPVHGPDALEKAAVVPDNVVVPDPVAPGPSTSSPDVAPDRTGAVLIPNVDTPGSPLAAQTVHGDPAGTASEEVSGTMALFKPDVPIVEEILEHGLRQGDASPVHVAFQGTPDVDSIRCDWRGIARTAAQRDDSVRYWLGLAPEDTLPHPAVVEILLMSALDAIEPPYIETAKSNFRAIARGGLSREYLFLTCFADYTVSSYLLGSGPTTITAAYDRMGEAASYELYVREHAAGGHGSDPPQNGPLLNAVSNLKADGYFHFLLGVEGNHTGVGNQTTVRGCHRGAAGVGVKPG